MKNFVLAAIACVGLISPAFGERIERGNLVTENIPETPLVLRDQLYQYQNTRSAGLGGWPAGGDGLYAITGFGQTPQVHFVEEPGGARHQITFYDEPVLSIKPSPTDPNIFAFTRDQGGDENYQTFLFDRSAGTAARLSDGVGRKGGIAWSDDGEYLAWYTTLKGATRGIVVASRNAPDERRIAFTSEGWWSPTAWSPDGSKILLFHYVSINESELHLLDVASGETEKINPSSNKIAYGDAEFSHDGGAIYYTSDEEGEFQSLYRYDLATGEKANLSGSINWDVEDVEVARDGRTYAFAVNEAGRSTLHIRSVKGDRKRPAPNLPAGIVYSMEYSPDGERLGLSLNAATSPTDVYSWDLRRRRLDRWTESEVGGLDTASFAEPVFFSYPTFDEIDGAPREIPAYMYKPEGPGPHPVVISIHGGPEGQSRPYFSSVHQFWTTKLGLAVIRPNVRGSTGYGKTYVTLDNGRNREESVQDIGALLDWIKTQPDLDENQVIVYGGSYGGYMVLASMVHYNDRLAGAVDIVGISNFVTFLENTADYRRDLRRAEYGDERDPEMRAFLESISPLNHVEKMSKPMLIIQGANDPRVPASEAEQILAAIRTNGGDAWYMLAKDEGHGFRKKSNRDAMTEAVVLFMDGVLELGVVPELAPTE